MRRLTWVLSVFFIFLLASCAIEPGLSPKERPKKWAHPIKIQGVPNLYQVSPVLFRSAQPSKEGLITLNKGVILTPNGKPIKTIINLRANSGNDDIVPPIGVNYQQIRFNTWNVKDQDVLSFLKTVTNPAKQPVLLHCKHGADRTGIMTAIYRIVVQNWSKADAIKEMRQGGFGYHPIWSNLIRYIENLDVKAWKAKLHINTKKNTKRKTKSAKRV